MIVQECGIGLVEVKRDGERLEFKAPELIRSGPLEGDELAEALRVAGIDRSQVVEAVHIANGPRWKLLRLASAEEVLAAEPAAKAAVGTDIGIAAPADPASGADWELRAFFADGHGRVREDPVTGSFNAGVAQHLFENGIAVGSYIAAQGRMTGANGKVYCHQDEDGSVWIGGTSATVCSQGQVPDIG